MPQSPVGQRGYSDAQPKFDMVRHPSTCFSDSLDTAMLHIRHAHITTNAIINITDNGTQQEAAGAAGELYSDLAGALLQV